MPSRHATSSAMPAHRAERPGGRRTLRRAGGAVAVVALVPALVFVTDVPSGAAPATEVALTRAADSAGAVPVGSATYAVPAGAVFVSPAGSDTAAGGQSQPVRTVARAIALAPAGGTVVLRGRHLPRERPAC